MQALALRRPTLSEALWPNPTTGVRVVEALAFSLLTALCARIQIPLPFTPVPLTGQTFAVLLSGALLGSRWGTISMAFYLAEGLGGLPVFAGGAGGIALLLGPTGGYLLGFLPAAWMTGTLAERGWDRSPWTAAAMMLIGSLFIFAVGLAGLARFVSPSQLLFLGLFPFIPGDILKACFAAAALPVGWKFLNRKTQ